MSSPEDKSKDFRYVRPFRWDYDPRKNYSGDVYNKNTNPLSLSLLRDVEGMLNFSDPESDHNRAVRGMSLANFSDEQFLMYLDLLPDLSDSDSSGDH